MQRIQRRSRRKAFAGLALSLTSLALAEPGDAAISFGRFSDFETGTKEGWKEGNAGDNPSNVPNGGPLGAEDNYLLHNSGFVGEDFFNPRQVFLNDTDWAGNLATAHVTRVQFDVQNFGPSTPIHVRVALLQDPFGLRQAFSTTSAELIPNDGAWHKVTFDLTPASMVQIEGTNSYNTVITDVDQFRILSSEFPEYRGDVIDSSMGVDNIRAFTLPGDADFDNTVATADFTLLSASFGGTGGWGQGDFNFDGIVNALDFNALATHFGESITPLEPPPGAIVPEPHLLSFAAGAALLALRRRRAR